MQHSKHTHAHTYLALGDSYTIGEGVSYEDCFPVQLVRLLNHTKKFDPPLIIAKTGWTTDELIDAIAKQNIKTTFDWVTLLIGVNNQYRGRDTSNFRKEFTELLATAKKFAANKPERVIVISIPDWSVTPFALNSEKDKAQLSKEIDLFNSISKWVAEQQSIAFIDITQPSRDAAKHSTLLANDGLHPSGKMYAEWAKKISETILIKLK